MNLLSHIESILFVASKPLGMKQIAKALNVDVSLVTEAIATLGARHNGEESGIRIFVTDDEVQMGTAPENSAVIEGFVKDEIAGELTKAQLETLTVIGYRGPITRPELEQIRGVNCSLILRNLLMRGLIIEDEDANALAISYRLSLDALRHLGITAPKELPDFDTLHAHEYVEQALGGMKKTMEGEQKEEE